MSDLQSLTWGGAPRFVLFYADDSDNEKTFGIKSVNQWLVDKFNVSRHDWTNVVWYKMEAGEHIILNFWFDSLNQQCIPVR